jgi:hypothetical protein
VNQSTEQPKPVSTPVQQTPAELEAQLLAERIQELIASGLYA